MTLIKSISGIRGTIGGKAGENFTPDDMVKFTAAYAHWVIQRNLGKKIVLGRDARLSGEIVSNIISGTLCAMGIDVINLGLVTTPTVEMAVVMEGCAGGIILTASHNPKQWNALKLLNEKGEFISAKDGSDLLHIAENEQINYCGIDEIGKISSINNYTDKHISKILELPLVDIKAIKEKNFKIVVDAVNSVGGIAVPQLLRALGVENIIELYCEPNGKFPHNPEPLPEYLGEISSLVKRENAHLGIVVDPDVDRLALVCEDGDMFGEEYTLVAVADYVLKNKIGNTVSNLSSSRALRDITERTGAKYYASAVGEVNVVEKMKEVKAVIGGEGNGGIIYPNLHYGRDAMVGIALFLTHLAKSNKSTSQLRAYYPNYIISKNKVELNEQVNVDEVLLQIAEKYKKQPINTIDGVKIEFDNDWVHLRKSNTEPIIRIYAESTSEVTANNLAKKIIMDIGEISKNIN